MFKFNHLEDVKMNYFQHFCYSSKISFINILGGFLGFIHAICPCIFTNIHNETLDTLKYYLDGTSIKNKKIE